MNDSNLKVVEKRTYMSYHQDGLIDIFVGTYILLFALGILLRSVGDFSTWFVIPAIFPAIMVPIWISIKKQITMPRIGYVKFRTGGANKLTVIFIALTVAGLGAFMAFTFVSTSQTWASVFRDIILSYSLLIMGVAAGTISSLFAYTMGLKRLYAYGILSLILFFTGYFIPIPFEYLILTIGLAIILYGLILLIQFLQKYPITQSEKSNAQKSF